jgi:copper oxidase (laccase) domain-containing protein
MITNLTKVNLIVYTADCMPMTFFDPIKKVIGIAHSGWRGTIAGIGIKMIELMKTEY